MRGDSYEVRRGGEELRRGEEVRTSQDILYYYRSGAWDGLPEIARERISW